MGQNGYQKGQGGTGFPHLGGLIKRKMKERRVTNSEMARRMGVASQTFGSYLKNESVQFRILWEIGLALEYNFFADLMGYLPVGVLDSAESGFQITILAQAEEIRDLKKEVEIYKGILKG